MSSQPAANGNDNDDPEPSTTEQIRQVLIERIVHGTIGAGERINEIQLANEFQVSRGPVREALRSLEQARLVTLVHNKGVFVRKLDIGEALHLYDVRSGLAYSAGKQLAQRATSEQIDELNEQYYAMENERERRDSEQYFVINEAFHSNLMRFTGNPRLVEIAQGIDRELRLFLRQGVVGPSQLRISNEQHRVIIDKITAGDAQGAANAFEEHVATGKMRALNSLITEVR